MKKDPQRDQKVLRSSTLAIILGFILWTVVWEKNSRKKSIEKQNTPGNKR